MSGDERNIVKEIKWAVDTSDEGLLKEISNYELCIDNTLINIRNSFINCVDYVIIDFKTIEFLISWEVVDGFLFLKETLEQRKEQRLLEDDNTLEALTRIHQKIVKICDLLSHELGNVGSERYRSKIVVVLDYLTQFIKEEKQKNKFQNNTNNSSSLSKGNFWIGGVVALFLLITIYCAWTLAHWKLRKKRKRQIKMLQRH